MKFPDIKLKRKRYNEPKYKGSKFQAMVRNNLPVHLGHVTHTAI